MTRLLPCKGATPEECKTATAIIISSDARHRRANNTNAYKAFLEHYGANPYISKGIGAKSIVGRSTRSKRHISKSGTDGHAIKTRQHHDTGARSQGPFHNIFLILYDRFLTLKNLGCVCLWGFLGKCQVNLTGGDFRKILKIFLKKFEVCVSFFGHHLYRK